MTDPLSGPGKRSCRGCQNIDRVHHAAPSCLGTSSMMDSNPNALDQQIVAREIDSFVPPNVFDAHAHFYDAQHFTTPPGIYTSGPKACGLTAYRQHMAHLLPNRELSGLFFALPAADLDVDEANQFTLQEVNRDPRSRMQLMVTPRTACEVIEKHSADPNVVGLKVYHCFADCESTFEAPISAMITEDQLQVANDHGLTITLHMVRQRALGDPVNQDALRDYSERFRNVTWILAHAARGFNLYDLQDGIDSIRDLQNMVCDTSAVTEPEALAIVLRALGPQRVMYGSDFPVTHLRGRCVTLGDSFVWLSPENVDTSAPYGEVSMCWVGVESLRAHRLACRQLGLSDADVEDLFHNNAVRLLGVDDT